MKTETILVIGGVVVGAIVINSLIKNLSNGNTSIVKEITKETVKETLGAAKDVIVGTGSAIWDEVDQPVIKPYTVGAVTMPQMQVYDLLNPFSYIFKEADAFKNALKGG